MAIRTAVIGLGIMGRRMAEHMVLHPEFTVATIWDPDPAACKAAQAVAPEAVLAETASEAMADVDLVYLACPPVPRKAYALEAAAAAAGGEGGHAEFFGAHERPGLALECPVLVGRRASARDVALAE